jgi:hypothetical protein
MTDVTRDFPALVDVHARGLLRDYRRELRRKVHDVRGTLAAYLADEFTLGRGDQGWQVLCGAYRRGELRGSLNAKGSHYLRSLRHFLRVHGYIPPGPSPIPCLP